MSRDHRKLRVFTDAHQLTLAIYKHTKNFPRDEWFGLRGQVRRAGVSIPTNIVEGSARRSTREYFNFLNIARASGSEVAYLIDLCFELELLRKDSYVVLSRMCGRLIPQLEALVQQVERLWIEERQKKRAVRKQRNNPKPRA
jgi:four helix bundle protein